MIKLLSPSKGNKRIIPFKYQLLGRCLNFLSYINNNWAARIISELWFTVFKNKTKPWTIKFWQTADNHIEVKVKDKNISVYLWGEGPLIVMMHGWSGSGSQFRKFIPTLVKAGYQIAIFDAPSHGLNPGKQSHLIDFTDTLISIQNKFGNIHTIIAHSFGAMATVVAMQRGFSAQHMILIAPHLDAHEMHKTYSGLLNLNPRLSERFRDLIEQKMQNILNVDKVWDYLSPDKLLSLNNSVGLLLYDIEDEEIPQKQFKDIETHWKNARTIKTDGLGHHRILKDKKTIRDVTDFISSTA